MAKIQKFQDLLVWKKAHELTLRVYQCSADYPKHELFGLVSQIRRASVGIGANIVEGFRRNTLKDSINFYTIADASLEELKYHILLSRDLGYLSDTIYTGVISQCEEVGKLLTRWIQSQRKYL